jgi:hypothetical protein
VTTAVLSLLAGSAHASAVRGVAGFDPAPAVSVRPRGVPLQSLGRSIVPIGDPPAREAAEALEESESDDRTADQPLGGRERVIDTTARLDPLASTTTAAFPGQPQYYSVPYDAAIAVGPTQVLVVTNNQFGVYDKATGALLASDLHIRFFGQQAGGGYDPKCFYDPVAGRFVMIALEVAEDPDRGLIDVAVTQTGDATGSWHRYLFDATMLNTDGRLTWADFPGLGFDNERVYLSTNQLVYRDSMAFRFSRVRAWKKQELYAGGPVTHVDFAYIKNADGTDAFAIKPAQPLEPTPIGRLFATRPRGASYVSTWTVTGTWPNLVLSDAVAVPVGAYARPVADAAQPASSERVDTRDCRTHDVVWRAGRWHTAFNERFIAGTDTTTAVRYLQLDDAGNAMRDVTYAAPGSYLFYPAVSVDPAGNVAMVYGRCSAVEFASIYHARMPAHGAFEPSGRVAAGIGPIETERWGDYNAVANDPADPNLIWLYAGYGALDNRWSSWIAAAKPSQPGPPVSVELQGPTSTRTIVALSIVPRRGQGARIQLELSRETNLRLTLHDVTGRRVCALATGGQAAGRHAIEWNGRDDSGTRVRQGVYWLKAEAGTESASRRAVVLE